MSMPWFMELESTAKAFEWFADKVVELHGGYAIVTTSGLRRVSENIRTAQRERTAAMTDFESAMRWLEDGLLFDIREAQRLFRDIEKQHGADASDAHIVLSRLNVAEHEVVKCMERVQDGAVIEQDGQMRFV